MAQALRPASHFSEKQNVNPAVDRTTQVWAEDFHHLYQILLDHAIRIDGVTRVDELAKFYDFHTSLQGLQAAYPVAEENGWAVINPGDGNPITIARFVNGVWVEDQNIAPIQIYNTGADLPAAGASGIWYIVRDEKIAYLWYDNKFNGFGKDGANGLTAYQHAVSLGFEGDLAAWLESLKGSEGKSAYQSAVDNGFVGTEAEWIASIEGVEGKSAYQVALDNGFVGTEVEWLASLEGGDGDAGASAYQVALNNGFVGTEAEWLASLEGGDGDAGASAYQVALDNGFVGTEAEWLASIKGDKGEPGSGFENIPAEAGKVPETDGAGGINWVEKPTDGGGDTSSALQAFAAYIDIVNGDDAVAQLRNPTKPYKTMGALITALPNDYSSFWNIYIIGGGNIDMPVMPSRNLIWHSTTLSNLDFTNTPSEYVISAGISGAIWDFRNGNISIISNHTASAKLFGISFAASYIKLWGHINNIFWKSPSISGTRAGMVFEAGTDIKINRFDQYSTSSASLRITGDSFIDIGTFTTANKYFVAGGSNTSNSELIIGNLSGSGIGHTTWYVSGVPSFKEITLKSISTTGLTGFTGNVFFDNCAYVDNANIIFGGGTFIGRLVGNTYLSGNNLNGCNFIDFEAKLGNHDCTSLNTFTNCRIYIQTKLVTWRNTIEYLAVFKGFNTIICETANSELIDYTLAEYLVSKIKVEGTLKTNGQITNFTVDNSTPNNY